MLIPVILCGGSGTRLWPLSRQLYPKQFLQLNGAGSLLQQTLERLRTVPDHGPCIVVCNEAHRFLVAEQLQACGEEEALILLEEQGRNTAPAVALAALLIREQYGDETGMLVLPSDHLFRRPQAFAESVAQAYAAVQDQLLTFGVPPTRPETGYGYIRAEAAAGAQGPRPVLEFAEKPDLERAERFLAAGDYYWNSGMFLFRAGVYRAELHHHAPAIAEACEAAYTGMVHDGRFRRPGAEAFARCPADSIDYAVMEKTDRAVMLPLDAGWSDIGCWRALHEALPRDGQGNVLQGDVLSEDTRNCYIRSEHRLVVSLGLDDHVIVETADAVLVAHRDRVQDIRGVVDGLRKKGREEPLVHRQVHRPWGGYETLVSSQRFQVKRLTVAPGASLSLQMHHHRAEHWTVVRGTARVWRGEEEFLLSEDQSVYIPIGALHRLENPGRIPLELVEVQTGAYLGEDDIVRFEDSYGRIPLPAGAPAAGAASGAVS
ncbi:mannose-1-phosphate guanylyltransferase/mannose-6-phosphate isomerase [Alkalilimnicola sp. S0819]|uniref:mannose-1-phosphate guanylyltransferase/mannose-6-phosphate isomerase n=1 Tax=Alkalilimnicola sp. S0819 TaxID=2613922 RepID=UPI001261C5CC|nr:mannose-1-phosphate guanylyltransferase/mannose-6-phosphate isomerase [Alkalilimnicola sp. S0819]KAB7627873.1 mannose-1-phosphate guanylyltransferase/mannose-6-phosphate isomerase [Alkalilimnicola sp. S0819]MPQ15509.1 mannose-1-phosphate guanylyltransferase/mannose-6-phosphate isomerase [Alkalilimnicola sp. S0819]